MTGKIFLLVLIALIGIVAYFGYNFYLDNSRIIQEFVAKPANTSQPSYESKLQFYPNMRFNKPGLGYSMGQ